MTFWVTHPTRAKAEKLAVAALLERSPWLTAVRWRIDDEGRLTAHFVVRHHDEDFQIVMTYPDYFPDVPPVLVPVDGRRLSAHQYPSGDLCLERRADNWSPDVRGAEMIESAYDLISGERAGDVGSLVPSAHDVSLGQTVRAEALRFVVDNEVLRDLRGRPSRSLTSVRLRMRYAAGCVVSFVDAVEGDQAFEPFKRNSVDGTWRRQGSAVRVPGDFTLRIDITIQEIACLLRVFDHHDLADEVASGGETVHLLFVSDSDATLLMLNGAGDARTVARDATIVVPDDAKRRNHEENNVLKSRAVAIVGCGSVGSKIAVSLARSGVGRFVLVDPDILFPANLQRHDLDGRFVGTHKVDGLQERIQETSEGTSVVARKVMLGGQESAETLASVLEELATCDLIVDATADANVFNYCASVSRNRPVAMMWVEVLAGGIGGLIARSRPELDPPPQEARRQIAYWTESRGVPAPIAADVPYAAGEDAVLIADDADVSTVAAHAARLAVDTLVRTSDSAFPSSVYFVGLTRSWIFDAPFDTWPVDYYPEGDWGMIVDADRAAQALELLRDLVAKDVDADISTG